MSKAHSLSEIRVVFEKKFNKSGREKILKENTYLYDSLAIEKVQVELTISGGRKVIIDFDNILDWEVTLDDIYIDGEILE